MCFIFLRDEKRSYFDSTVSCRLHTDVERSNIAMNKSVYIFLITSHMTHMSSSQTPPSRWRFGSWPWYEKQKGAGGAVQRPREGVSLWASWKWAAGGLLGAQSVKLWQEIVSRELQRGEAAEEAAENPSVALDKEVKPVDPGWDTNVRGSDVLTCFVSLIGCRSDLGLLLTLQDKSESLCELCLHLLIKKNFKNHHQQVCTLIYVSFDLSAHPLHCHFCIHNSVSFYDLMSHRLWCRKLSEWCLQHRGKIIHPPPNVLFL